MRERTAYSISPQVKSCESSFFHKKKISFPLQKQLEEALSTNFSPYELRHPWLKTTLIQDFPLLYQELHHGRLSSGSSLSAQWIKKSIQHLDYVFPPEVQTKSKKTAPLSPCRNSFTETEGLPLLKQSFLKEYTTLLQEEFKGYFQCYQEEYRHFDLLFPFMCFLIKTLDEALSNVGPWFEENLNAYREHFNKENQESASSILNETEQINSELDTLEKLLDNKHSAFISKTLAFLKARGYTFLSRSRFEKQFKKAFPDLFSKRIFLNALKKGAHANIISKKPHLGAIELHKILGWRIIVLADKKDPTKRNIEGIYTQHDEYMKRLALFQ
ncbi:MAG: hypothetical protein DLD55_05205 [candidate division SR1 bacterium]|nr:MAG: hypothetical protein DLD55_05205 [candidate division SR1 bacterium]